MKWEKFEVAICDFKTNESVANFATTEFLSNPKTSRPIYTLLVAYEMQMVKAIYYSSSDRTTLDKMAVMAALNLYLSFINIFIHLMRIMGNRN